MNVRYRLLILLAFVAGMGSQRAGFLIVWCLPVLQSTLTRVTAARLRFQRCSCGSFGHKKNVVGISQYDPAAVGKPAWNAGKQVGAKRALKIRQVWSIRFFLDREGRMRDRAFFDLALDSKLRSCDLVKIKIGTLVAGQAIRSRSLVVQHRTSRPIQFEITADARASLLA